MNLTAAWQISRGSGVLIGHPDTGYLRHPEIESAANGGRVRDDLGHDFVDDDRDPQAELDDDTLLPGGPNHGTSTASVIGSPSGNEPAGGEFVVGVAPESEIVPLRVANSVVHFSLRRVREAIRFAADKGCHVVSLSLGGPFPSPHLRRELNRAAEKGVVVINAAGNHVPFHAVVFPARYDEVIAVAASNAIDEPWSGSSRGDRVDITAPGESVYRALVQKEGAAKPSSSSKRSSGTSYAAAHVAGICALWIAHHGHGNLRNRFGSEIPQVFRRLLRATSRPGKNMDPGDFVGIVDAERLLAAPLPQKRPHLGHKVAAAKSKEDVLEPFRALLPHLSDEALRLSLSQLLEVSERNLTAFLRKFGLEVAMQLATDQRLLRDFDAQARATSTLKIRARHSTTGRTMESLNRRLGSLSISPSLKDSI